MKERKNCYEKYVRIRAVEERKERVQKLKEKKEEFKQLLDDAVSSSRFVLVIIILKSMKKDNLLKNLASSSYIFLLRINHP